MSFWNTSVRVIRSSFLPSRLRRMNLCRYIFIFQFNIKCTYFLFFWPRKMVMMPSRCWSVFSLLILMLVLAACAEVLPREDIQATEVILQVCKECRIVFLVSNLINSHNDSSHIWFPCPYLAQWHGNAGCCLNMYFRYCYRYFSFNKEIRGDLLNS